MTERPLECSMCDKAAKILYTEITDGEMRQYTMCENCPCLQAKLGESSECSHFSDKENVCCVECGSSLADMFTTMQVGCSACYQIFHDSIIALLIKGDLLPKQKIHLIEGNPSHALHMGRKPVEDPATSLSSRIVELNNALSLALQDENYEQAASIRDEINNLMNTNEQ